MRAALLTLVFAFALPAQDVLFNRDVRPILSDKCFACHGPDAQNRKTPLRLDTAAGATMELPSGRRAVVAGDPSVSVLIERVKSEHEMLRMPPAYAGREKLSEREIGVLERWIAQGAEYQGHWAFIPPVRPAEPAGARADWARNPIDRFILRGLEQRGLAPSPEADKARLIRRATLDLTGLPPAPEEVDAFLVDNTPGAFERVVDRLLESPRYGERMAQDWLDAARYADTNGYQSDGERTMWPWRDWVVEAFNRNLPFDRFTVWQIAGDLLPGATPEQRLATGFQRNLRTNAEGGIVEEEFLAEYAADRVETTGTVWLGLTVGCARCHDHKYDPIAQKDFYRLFAYYNQVPERGLVYNFGNDGPVMPAPSPAQSERLASLEADARSAHERLAKMEPEIARAQAAWVKSLAAKRLDDEFPRESLAARFALDGDYSDAAFSGVDDAETNRVPEPAEAAYAPGAIGRAARFDGQRFLDGGAIAGFQYNDAFTVSLWLRAEDAADAGVVSRMQDVDEGSGWGLLLRDGRLRFEFTMRHTDLSLRVETRRTIEPGAWRHVAIAFGGKLPSHRALTIRLDGEEWPFEVEWDDLKWPIGYRAYPLRIGAAAGRRFQGEIDEVRLYSSELSAEEVAALAVREPLAELAARPQLSKGEAAKLRTAFLETGASEQIASAVFAAAEAERRRAAFADSIPTVMVMADADEPRPAHVLERGAYDAPGEAVVAGVPDWLAPLPEGAPANRLGLARWLVDPKHPLTARVTVNRLWAMLFGRGIVATVEDFGSQGEWPSHPELLDWLAVEFVESGWDVKHMLRLMATSAAYRQSSKATPQLLEADPENRLLSRGPRRRLPAPAIRDQALAASGLLNGAIGGPPVKPYQPEGLWEELSSSSYRPDTGDKLYRRSLYTYWKRTVAPPAMAAFDASDRESCIVGQSRTNTPLQALNLMNDVTYLEASRKLAERMLREAGSTAAERIERGFRLAVARRPDEGETLALAALQERLFADYRRDPFVAEQYLGQGESPRDPALDPVELASWTGVASLLLNLDETVTKE